MESCNNRKPQITVVEDEKKIKIYKKTIFNFLIKVSIFFVVLFITFTFIFGVYFVSGESMFPKLRDGDFVLYSKINNDYSINEIIVFETNNILNISRVVAKEGDVIGLNYKGYITINGDVKKEEIFYETTAIAGGIKYPYVVPKNNYFVMSDYRSTSSDSRFFGAIPKSKIKGKIISLIRMRSF